MKTKKRIAHIAPISLKDDLGIARKVRAQVKAFERAGFECNLVVPKIKRSLFASVLSCLPFGRDRIDWKALDVGDYDGFYIRRTMCTTPAFLAFLRNIKKARPNTPIVYEIPTYPYDKELLRPIYFIPMLLRDRWNRSKLRKYVDRIADLSGQKKIFGIPTLYITNGIDPETVRPRKPSFSPDCINVAFAAIFYPWHGIDRMIQGMGDYYAQGGKRNIELYLMGDGPERQNLENQARTLGIEDKCHFLGMCDREKMDKVFDDCTIAVELLGGHRKNLLLSASLKSREYLAKGLPFIYEGEVDVFRDEPVDFCLNVPADESPVCIDDVISFYDNLYGSESEEDLIARIHAYALKHVSIDATMKSVSDFFVESLVDTRSA